MSTGYHLPEGYDRISKINFSKIKVTPVQIKIINFFGTLSCILYRTQKGIKMRRFTIREERGIPGNQPVVDSLAPLYHVRPDAPPLLLITGDRELEMLGRYEENAYLMRMMKVSGHKETRLYELEGYGHDMTAPAFPLLLNEVQRIANK